MKYKILKGNELFNKLIEIKKKIEDYNNQANELALELGGINKATNGRYLSGGIDAIEFKDKPDGWRSVGDSWQNLYYPKVKNKEILKKINSLPRMEFDEINNIVNFREQFVSDKKGIAHVRCVGLKFHKDFILMETAEGVDYTPIENVIEILGSEYDELAKKIKKVKWK